MSDRIKVGVKVRPLIEREIRNKATVNWKVVSENSICQIDSSTGQKRGEEYKYDHVFGSDSSNDEIFEVLAKPIVEASVKGFNGTVFAYGQTSSGKTYTMMGDKFEQGIIPKAVHYIFDLIENTPNRQFLLRVCFMEIYNEKLYDLLNQRNDKLKISEDQFGNVFVKNINELVTDSPQMVLDLMRKGEEFRKIGETKMNVESSRSHSIFRIILESRDCTSSDPDEAVHVSHLNLVDLAGSERTGATGASGERLKEGCSINRSLFMLGHVIQQLCDEEPFVSFRDSKLTRILQSSLGGNALTTVICAVTPASIEETSSTLGFATRVGNVKNSATVNEVLSDTALLKRYWRQIEKLTSELDEVKGQKNNEKLALEQKNSELLERIHRLKSHLIVSSTSIAAPADQQQEKLKKLRRRTWSAPNRRVSRFSMAPFRTTGPVSNLNSIEEEVSLSGSSCSVEHPTMPDFDNSEAFTTPLEEFEKQLIQAEMSHFLDTSNSFVSVSFEDEENVKQEDSTETNLRNSLSVNYVQTRKPRKIRFQELKEQDSKHPPGTPPEKLRQRAQLAENELEEIREFTQLEKQIFNEDLIKQIKDLQFQNNDLQKELLNLQSGVGKDTAELRVQLDNALAHNNILEKELSVLRSANPNVCDFTLLLLDANKKSAELQDQNKSLSENLKNAYEKCKSLEETIASLRKAENQLELLKKDKVAAVESLKSQETRLSQLESDKNDFDMTISLITKQHELKEKSLTEALQKAWAEIESSKSLTPSKPKGLEVPGSSPTLSSEYSDEVSSFEKCTLKKKISALVTENADLQLALKRHVETAQLEDQTWKAHAQSRPTSFFPPLSDLVEEPGIDELMQEVASLKEEKIQLGIAFNEEKDILEQKITDLHIHMEDYRDEAEKLRSLLSSKLKLIESLETALQDIGHQMENQIKVPCKTTVIGDSDNTSCENIIEEETCHLSSLEANDSELQALKTENKVLMSEACCLNAETNTLRKLLSQAEDNIKCLQIENDHLNSKIDVFSENLLKSQPLLCIKDRLSCDIKSVSDSNEELVRLSTTLEAELRTLEEERHFMQEKLKTLHQENVGLVSHLQDVEDQIERTKALTDDQKEICAKLVLVKEEHSQKNHFQTSEGEEFNLSFELELDNLFSLSRSTNVRERSFDSQFDKSYVISNGAHQLVEIKSQPVFEVSFGADGSDRRVMLTEGGADPQEDQENNDLIETSSDSLALIRNHKPLLSQTPCDSCKTAFKHIWEENQKLSSLADKKAKESDQFRELSDELRRDVLALKKQLLCAFEQNEVEEAGNDQSLESGNSSMCDGDDLETFESFNDEKSSISQICEDLKNETMELKLNLKQKEMELTKISEENTKLHHQLKSNQTSDNLGVHCDSEKRRSWHGKITPKEELFTSPQNEKANNLQDLSSTKTSLTNLQEGLETLRDEASKKMMFDSTLNRTSDANLKLQNQSKSSIPEVASNEEQIDILNKPIVSRDANTEEPVLKSMHQEFMKVDVSDQDQVKAEIKQIWEENLNLQNMLQSLITEVTSKNEEIARLEVEKAIVLKDITLKDTALASLHQELKSIQMQKLEKHSVENSSEEICAEKSQVEELLKSSVAEVSSGEELMERLESEKQNASEGISCLEACIMDQQDGSELREVESLEKSRIESSIDKTHLINIRFQDELTNVITEVASKEEVIAKLETEKRNSLENVIIEEASLPLFQQLPFLKLEAAEKKNLETNVDDLKVEILRLQEQLESSKAEVALKEKVVLQLETEKQNAEENVIIKEAAIVSMHQELESLKAESTEKTNLKCNFDKMQAENMKLQEQLKSSVAEVALKEDVIAQLNAEKQNALEDISIKEASLRDLLCLKNEVTAKNRTIENNLIEIGEENVRLEEHVKSLSATIASKEEAIARLETEKRNAEENVIIKEAAIVSMHKELESLKVESTEKTNLECNFDKMQAEIMELQEQLKSLVAEVALKEDVIAQLETEKQNVLEDISIKEASLRDLLCLKNEVTTKNRTIENNLIEIGEENVRLEEHVKSLSATIAAKEEAIARLETEKRNVEENVIIKEAAIVSMHKELESLKVESTEKTNLKCNFDKMQAEITKLQEQLKSSVAEVALKEEVIAQLEEEKQNVVKDASTKEASIASLHHKLESMKDEAVAKCAMVETSLGIIREENVMLQDQLKSLRDEVFSKEEVIVKLNAEKQNAMDDVNLKESALASLRDELECLKVEVQEKINIENSLDKMREENLRLQNKLTSLIAENNSKEELITRLEGEEKRALLLMNVEDACPQTLCEELESLKVRMCEQKTQLEVTLNKVNEENIRLNHKLNDYELLLENVKELKAKLVRKEDKILQLEQEKKNILLDVENKEASLASLHQQSEARCKLLQSKASSLLSDLSEKIEAIQDLEKQITNLKSLIFNKDHELEVLGMSSEKVKKELNELRVQLSKERQDKEVLLHLKSQEKPLENDNEKSLRSTINQYKVYVDQVQSQNRALQKQIQALKSQKSNEEDIIPLQTTIQNQLETIKQLREEIIGLNEKVDDLNKDCDEMQSSIEFEQKSANEQFQKYVLECTTTAKLHSKLITSEMSKVLFIVTACKYLLKGHQNSNSEQLSSQLSAKEIAARNSLARVSNADQQLSVENLGYWTLHNIKKELAAEEKVASCLVDETLPLWDNCVAKIKERGGDELLKYAHSQEVLAVERLNKITHLTDQVTSLTKKLDTLDADLQEEKRKVLQLSKKSPLTARFLEPSSSAKKIEQLQLENKELREKLNVVSLEIKSKSSVGLRCGHDLNEEMTELRMNVADKNAEVAHLKKLLEIKNQPAEKKIALLKQQLSDVQKKCADLKDENRKLAKTWGDVTFPECVVCTKRKKETKSALVQTDDLVTQAKSYSLSGAPSGIVEEFVETNWQSRAIKLGKEKDLYKRLCVERGSQIKELRSQLQRLQLPASG